MQASKSLAIIAACCSCEEDRCGLNTHWEQPGQLRGEVHDGQQREQVKKHDPFLRAGLASYVQEERKNRGYCSPSKQKPFFQSQVRRTPLWLDIYPLEAEKSDTRPDP